MVPRVAIGAQVGAYRLVGELGGGGMGVVYRAVHTQLDRPTAIKVLRPELGQNVWALDRFLTEARAAAGVRHPGIVEIYDYGIMASGQPFIAMELLEGVTLGQRLAAHGRLVPAEATRVARQIAEALAAAHDRGVVHRDLKPDNVFLVRDRAGAVDRVKLLDFGIAKRDGHAAPSGPAADLILGTPVYMSPEQCRGQDEGDHRADLYSLGCILCEMLSGEPPYGRSPTEVLLVAHQVAPIPDLAARGDVPRELARLVSRLLAKCPEVRPRDALEVVAVLDRWLAGCAPAPRARRSSVRVALGAASEVAGWFAALGMWHRAWRSSPVSVDDDRADERSGLEGGKEPRIAAGTGRSARVNNAPTEPGRGELDGKTRRFQLVPTRPLLRQAPVEAELTDESQPA
jgi:eukaryotic-like serine/threonine-protein kinase